MVKRANLDKVLKIKEMRRKLAELEVARANGEVRAAAVAVEEAHFEEREVIRTGALRRAERLEKLLDAKSNPAVENARIRNVYKSVDFDIDRSKFQTQCRTAEHEEAQDRARLKQQEMARLLQRETRTRKLCERLEQKDMQEAFRLE